MYTIKSLNQKENTKMGNIAKILSLNREYTNIMFDLGFHNGDTSEYYLKNGYKVVGVDCNQNILNAARCKFAKYINKGDLIVLDKCISDKNDDVISFYISTYPVWSSCNKQIAERIEEAKEVKVETITLLKLIETYGCPIYCKIDIEGNDVYAVRSLGGHKDIPQYISVEAECLGIGENSTINMIDELYNVGYRRFFIVDQRGNEDFRFDFYKQYKWFNYDEICKQFDELKKQDFNYGVWADIYASR